MKIKSVMRYVKSFLNTAKRYSRGVNYKPDIRHIAFEMTNLCNSKCDMCNIWANQDNSNELTRSEIKKIFSDPALYRLEDILLTGGEMFMREDILDVIKDLHTLHPKARIFVSTNGLLAEKISKIATELFELKIEIYWGVSLDGVGARHDDRRRVEGNFDLIDRVLLPKLMELRERNSEYIKIAVGMCLDDYGVLSFDELHEYCLRRDIPFLAQMIEDFDYYLPEKKRDRKSDEWEKIHFQKVGIEGENRLLREAAHNFKNDAYSKCISKLVPTVHHYRLLRIINGGTLSYECSSFRNFFLLRYDGAMTPCLRFSDWEIGNLKTKTIFEISENPKYKNAVDEILKCDGCLNTWCTDWSMELNALPFRSEVAKWFKYKLSDAVKKH